MSGTRTISYQLHFDRPVDEVWDVVSDTERLNDVGGTGFAPYIAEEKTQSDGSVIRQARKRMGFFTWRWTEGFGEWVEGRFFSQKRTFENGPFRNLNLRLSVASSGAGTDISLEFDAVWENLLGDFLAAAGYLKPITEKVVKGVEQLMLDHIAAETEKGSSGNPQNVNDAEATSARQQLAHAVEELEAGDHAYGLAARLANYLTTTHELDLRQMRPLQLADEWGEPEERVVALFIAAHKAGLLAMRWEIMCPRCRGGKSENILLSDVPREVHCSSCNIDYGSDFTNNVELVFSPPQWLRVLPEGEFCLMSPASTRHVKVQCDLEPGQTRVETAELADGHYRIRTLEIGGECEVELYGGAVPQIEIGADAVMLGDPGAPGEVQMVNADGRPRTLVIENTALSEHALTGSKVIVSSAFRELCPEQILRAGDSVEIDKVAILFSDLKGSTALYEKIGDARAFALVRDHFEYLEQHIKRHNGTVVKTIGDAVMASFAEGGAAISAAFDIQDNIAQFNDSNDGMEIELKIGVHEGQSISVTTDNFLDYFGSTVNMAARLQAQAMGGEIVLSQEISNHPVAQAAIKDRKAEWKRAKLAGFAKQVPFLKVTTG